MDFSYKQNGLWELLKNYKPNTGVDGMEGDSGMNVDMEDDLDEDDEMEEIQ